MVAMRDSRRAEGERLRAKGKRLRAEGKERKAHAKSHGDPQSRGGGAFRVPDAERVLGP
jgi:hypothetical protein